MIVQFFSWKVNFHVELHRDFLKNIPHLQQRRGTADCSAVTGFWALGSARVARGARGGEQSAYILGGSMPLSGSRASPGSRAYQST